MLLRGLFVGYTVNMATGAVNNLDKLVLGTVQLGLRYGINNKFGKPGTKEALAILDRAFERGIKMFDTASAYGDSEEILGRFITTRNVGDVISIISKPKLPPDLEQGKNVYAVLEKEIGQSLNRLNRTFLDGYLLHSPDHMYNSSLLSALLLCKERGLARKIGISLYTEEEALYAARLGVFDHIQIPYSVFDQRLNGSIFFEIAKKNHIKIFARSAFLQGLIFMKENKVPDHLAAARPYLREFDEVIKRYNLSRLEAAMMFSYENPEIDYVVFGIDSVRQLDKNVDVVENLARRGVSKAYMRELKNKFISIPKEVIMPNLWQINLKK